MAVITKKSNTDVVQQHSIKNLFPRTKPDNKFIDTTEFSKPVFGMVKNWVVTEKIDGMNIRIHANQNGDFLIGGKTSNTDFRGNNDLLDVIRGYFPDTELEGEETGLTDEDEVRSKFILDRLSEIGYDGYSVTLFGEGYGGSINGGGKLYGDEKRFILYDARFSKDDGRSFYAPFSDVQAIGEALGLDVVRSFELQDATMIYNWMRETISAYDSEFVDGDGYPCEGVVAYPAIPLYDSFGERIVFKLKIEDVRKAMIKEAEESAFHEELAE